VGTNHCFDEGWNGAGSPLHRIIRPVGSQKRRKREPGLESDDIARPAAVDKLREQAVRLDIRKVVQKTHAKVMANVKSGWSVIVRPGI
jgi:hypothetical protein